MLYKEKLINYINMAPGIDFIIKIDDDFMLINFSEKENNYFFSYYDIKILGNGEYEKIAGPYIESLDKFDENTCEIFYKRYEEMILAEYSKNIELSKNE